MLMHCLHVKHPHRSDLHRILVLSEYKLELVSAGPSSSAGGRGREARDWKGPGLVARQMTLSKPKTLRVSLDC